MPPSLFDQTYSSFNGLTQALTNVTAAAKGGQSRLESATDTLMISLVVIEIVLMGLWVGLDSMNVAQVFKKVLALGFWIWLARSFSGVAQWFVQFLSGAGLQAGGMEGKFSVLKDPSGIASDALKLTQPLVQYMMDLSLSDWQLGMILCGLWWAILLIYLLIAINIFVAMLEFQIFAVLAGVLMPFGVSPFTRTIAEKGINIVIASGVKLMTLGFILAIVRPTLGKLKITDPSNLNQLWAVVMTAGALAFLSWQAPRMAASMVHGSPGLSAGSLMSNALGLYGAARMAWSAASVPSVASAISRTALSRVEAAAVPVVTAAISNGATSLISTAPPSASGGSSPSDGKPYGPSPSGSGPSKPDAAGGMQRTPGSQASSVQPSPAAVSSSPSSQPSKELS